MNTKTTYSHNRDEIEYVQKELMKAGYSTPRISQILEHFADWKAPDSFVSFVIHKIGSNDDIDECFRLLTQCETYFEFSKLYPVEDKDIDDIRSPVKKIDKSTIPSSSGFDEYGLDIYE